MRRSPNSVISRSIAALLGGFIVANAVGAALAKALPASQTDAVVMAMMLGFLVYALAALWAFAAKSARTAWLGLSGAVLISLSMWGLLGL
ncbi:MAG: hypothetical protein ACI89U_000991 [Gammaproteobacteria bacterium]|jgi:hypothetical protein